MSVDLVQSIPELRAVLTPRRGKGPVVLVPTMGALHAGHTALIRRASELARNEGGGAVLVSIFVNPTQFGPAEDFQRYPRPLAEDLAVCENAGAAVVFTPSAEELYAANHSVRVEETALSRGLCGRDRPGHFPGVCLVVLKLFWITLPDIAVFGEKDFQQLAVIRRLVRDLNIPVRIEGTPTVRESDGLALSSRNVYLTSAQRQAAPGIYRALQRGQELHAAQPDLPAADLVAHVSAALRQIPESSLGYVAVVDAESLEPVSGPLLHSAVLAAAVQFGTTRLIDHIGLV